jgi:hypothetical protein
MATHTNVIDTRPDQLGLRTANVRRPWTARLMGGLSAAVGAVSGIAPHVLHHIGPLAGAALVSGAAGSVLFGALGFLLTVPLLLRLRRHFGTWLAPAIALVLFAGMFTISTLWVGPAIRGDGGTTERDAHDDHDHARVSAPLRYASRRAAARLEG